jgi:hypothetical protein
MLGVIDMTGNDASGLSFKWLVAKERASAFAIQLVPEYIIDNLFGVVEFVLTVRSYR